MAWPGTLTSEEAEITQVLTDYYRAFSTLEVHAVLPYFHEPTMLIGPQAVYAAPTRDVVMAIFRTTMEGLRARGFARSELSLRHVNRLSATAVLANGVAIRYKTDGQELERAGVTYLMHQSDGNWRIATLVLHDPAEG